MLVQALTGEQLQLMARSVATLGAALVLIFALGSWQLFLVLVALVPTPALIWLATRAPPHSHSPLVAHIAPLPPCRRVVCLVHD